MVNEKVIEMSKRIACTNQGRVSHHSVRKRENGAEVYSKQSSLERRH